MGLDVAKVVQTSGERTPGAGRDGRPTLKTIAYMTGLGVTAVSRALKDAPDIGEATKERVRLVARQIGYRPNRAGVRLRTGKTNVIALLLSVEQEALGLASHIVYGVSEQLATTPYHLIVLPYDAKSDPLEPVRYIVETGAADGLIFSRTEPRDPRVRYLHEHSFPFASHGRTDMDIVHAYVDFDNERFAEIAVERLAARGRRRLALLRPPPHLTYWRHMTSGYARAVGAHGLADVQLPGLHDDWDYDAMQVEMARLMAAPGRPDGLVCSSAQSAIAAIGGAEAAGLTIGRDFDLVVKESFNLMRKFRPAVEVVREDFRTAGKNLAQAVLGAIDGQPATDLQVLDSPA